MKKVLFLLLLLVSLDSFSQDTSKCLSMLPLSIYPVSADPTSILCYRRYVVGFSVIRHTPYWSAEKITVAEVSAKHYPRKDHFRQDSEIPSQSQGSLKAYVGTAFDKGHLTNFDDLGDDAIAADESFYMTNMVPQYSSNNRGIWNALEHRVRKLPLTKGTIFVITGAILDANGAYLKDGSPIPTKLFKIVIIPQTKEMLTIVVPNSPDVTTSSLPSFITSIASLKLKDYLIRDFQVPIGYTELKQFPK